MKSVLHSPASILRRVAYPVEPLRLGQLPRQLPLPLLQGERDRLRQQPSLFDQVNDRQPDQFKCIHNSEVGSTRSMCFALAGTVPSGFPPWVRCYSTCYGVQRFVCAFPSDAFCANCMTGGTKAEQFARYCQTGGSRCEVPKMCKWLSGNSLRSY